MNDDDPEPPAEETDLLTLLIQAAACTAFAYYAWSPLDDLFRPIVDATLGSLLRAMGL